MKTKIIIYLLLLFSIKSQAQSPVLHSTLPSGGVVTEMEFKGMDTAFCIIGINLYRSTDGAKNWTLSKGLQFGGAYNFTCLSLNGNKILTGLNSGGRYYESLDGGDTWSDVKFFGLNQRVSDIQILNSGNIFVLCSGNSGSVSDVSFIKSTDGGQTWSTPTNFSKRGYDAQTQFINSNTGIVYYQNYMYKTSNGGSTWDTVAGINSSIKSAYILNEQLAFAGINEGSLYKSTDAFASWSVINPNGNLDWENQIYFLNATKGIVSTGYTRDFKINITNDGGATWTTFADGVNFKRFVYKNDNVIYLYGGNNNVYKTSLSSTGMENNQLVDFKVFPNPSNGVLNIQLNESKDDRHIKVFDFSGRVVYETDCINGNCSIEINEKGLYLLKVGENIQMISIQ